MAFEYFLEICCACSYIETWQNIGWFIKEFLRVTPKILFNLKVMVSPLVISFPPFINNNNNNNDNNNNNNNNNDNNNNSNNNNNDNNGELSHLSNQTENII